VFRDVAALLAAGARVIKFVDRTFNLTDERTLEIWHHLLAHREAGVTFHFEIAPDRLTEAQLRFLESAPSGLFQVEAGIQTVHGQTLQAISRVMDVDKALHALARLHAAGTVHVHADLIAGLPGETPEMFADSFSRLYGARPHQLQLGSSSCCAEHGFAGRRRSGGMWPEPTRHTRSSPLPQWLWPICSGSRRWRRRWSGLPTAAGSC
jgi:hypothetical protein